MSPPIILLPQLPDGRPAASLSPWIRLFTEQETCYDGETESVATSTLGTKLNGPSPTLDASNSHKRAPLIGLRTSLYSIKPASHATDLTLHVPPVIDWPSPPSSPLIPSIRLHRSLEGPSDISPSSLRAEFRGTILTEYPIVDFVERVWSATPWDIPSGIYGVRSDIQKRFRKAYNENQHIAGRDIETFETFKNVLKDLAAQVDQYARLPRTSTLMDLHRHEWDELGIFCLITQKEKVSGRFRPEVVVPFKVTDGLSPENPQQRSSELAADDILPIRTIRKLFLRHTVRSFVSGFSVVDDKIILWYADRMGIVKSKPFKLFQQLDYLVLLAVALRNPTRLTRFGVSPFVSHFCREGALRRLTFPPPHVSTVTSYNELQFTVVPGREPWNEWKVVGRGTRVIPVIASDGKTKSVCGRGPLVVKHAWPLRSAPREDNIIGTIRERIRKSCPPKWLLARIVEVKASYTFKMDDPHYGLPRASMDLRHWRDAEERVCRVLVMEQHQPLESVRNSYEFEDVYYDVLDASNWVFRIAGVLHRDISINNIMYRRTAHGSVEGVLCDWDLALDTRYPSHSARSVVGTSLFMSIDRLLAGDPIKTFQTFDTHRQEHDLESFFHLLVFFVATRKSNYHTEAMHSWYGDSYLTIAEEKRKFLYNEEVYDEFFPNNLGEYERFLGDDGLIPILREKWRDAYMYTCRTGMKAIYRAKMGTIPNDILTTYRLHRAETLRRRPKFQL